jgi:predicted nucleic acid-binding protein
MTSDAGQKPKTRRLYLDTSAYLCLLLGEKGSDALAREFAGAELLSSVLLVLETRRNVVRLARDGTLTAEQCTACLHRMDQDVENFILRDLTLDLCQSSVMPVVSTPRSLDLAHLRTALWFDMAERIDRFVTMDALQSGAAKELGLPTASIVANT